MSASQSTTPLNLPVAGLIFSLAIPDIADHSRLFGNLLSWDVIIPFAYVHSSSMTFKQII
jgi:hypothetical protein